MKSQSTSPTISSPGGDIPRAALLVPNEHRLVEMRHIVAQIGPLRPHLIVTTGVHLKKAFSFRQPAIFWSHHYATGARGILSQALNFLAKAIVVGARWAGRHRSRALEAMAEGADEDKDKQIVLLEEQLAELQSLVEIFKARARPTPR